MCIYLYTCTRTYVDVYVCVRTYVDPVCLIVSIYIYMLGVLTSICWIVMAGRLSQSRLTPTALFCFDDKTSHVSRMTQFTAQDVKPEPV